MRTQLRRVGRSALAARLHNAAIGRALIRTEYHLYGVVQQCGHASCWLNNGWLPLEVLALEVTADSPRRPGRRT